MACMKGRGRTGTVSIAIRQPVQASSERIRVSSAPGGRVVVTARREGRVLQT